MQIDTISISEDKKSAKVTIINGFWFSASRKTETYVLKKDGWRKLSDLSICPVWISLAIDKKMQ